MDAEGVSIPHKVHCEDFGYGGGYFVVNRCIKCVGWRYSEFELVDGPRRVEGKGFVRRWERG